MDIVVILGPIVANKDHLVVCPSNNWHGVGMILGVSKPVPALSVTDAQREVLESLARSQSGPHREVVRAKALLMAADGASNATIAARLSVSRSTVANWRTRFTEDGLVKAGPRGSGPQVLDPRRHDREDRDTHQGIPPGG